MKTITHNPVKEWNKIMSAKNNGPIMFPNMKREEGGGSECFLCLFQWFEGGGVDGYFFHSSPK